MQQNGHTVLSGSIDSSVSCKTSQGVAIQAAAVRLTRHLVIFEIDNPECILRTSETLNEFKILLNEREVYSGSAVVASVINTGAAIVCEVALSAHWIDIQTLAPGKEGQLLADFDGFLSQWQKNYKLRPEFKLAVADLETLLTEMRTWLDQVELGVQAQPANKRKQFEHDIISGLLKPILPVIGTLFSKFEDACGQIDAEQRPAHRAYVQRQLHPLVLCAPFMYRTFKKPLGYAGDYEMVAMMMRDPQEGASVFAKVLNAFFLHTPPVVGHRNRIEYLKNVLTREMARVARQGRRAKVFNLGCGPAKELQDFIADSPLSEQVQFTLLDFNKQTVDSTGGVLQDIIKRSHRGTTLEMVEKSVVQVLKEAARAKTSLFAANYDLVYCAGLFDYLPDYVCQKLMSVFYNMLAPGGLVVATNVDTANPARNWMELSVDWHLVYRNGRQMTKLIPPQASAEDTEIMSEPTGVNTFIEIRKPSHA
jgi:extracellular factor (EF) 3-hydroxypalmitic acid methyl ester biosynthesis protein